MNRKRFSAAAAGVLALGLVIGAPATAEAKVKAKNTLSKGDITKVISELNGGTFETSKSKTINVPGKTCGVTQLQSVKSAITNAGVSSDALTTALAGAAEFKKVGQAKKFMKSYKKFVTKCKSFTHSETGAKVTVKKIKTPKFGQDRVGVAQTTTVTAGDYTAKSYSSSVLIRQGKRIAEVAVIKNSSAVPAKQMKKLGKVAAKKIKK